jgi:Mg-chelatase subunit ChlD
MAKKKVTTTTVTTTVTEEVVSAKKKVTRVALVIDRSGSMGSVRGAAFNGINEQIAVLRRDADKGGETFVTYIQFDDQFETVFENRSARELVDITSDQYSPRGGTAMRDAMARAIGILQAQTKEDEDTVYLVVTISDGEENASKEVTAQQLAKQIKALEASGDWTFTMMLSNVDPRVATTLGLTLGNVATYTSTVAGTADAFETMRSSTANYFGAREANTRSVSSFYVQPTGDLTAQTTVTVPLSGSLTISI